MRILFVKLGAIGDVIHTLPSLAAVRRALPECEISWVVESRSAEILRGNPLIDRLIEVDTRTIRATKIGELLPELRRQVKGLRGHRFDLAIDFQGLLKSAVIAKLSGAKRRYGFARSMLREPSSRLLLTDAVETLPEQHVIRKNLALLAGALGIAVPDTDFEFPIATTGDDVTEAREIRAFAGEKFALLNPAGGWLTKLWPAENYGKLADRIWSDLGLVPIVVTGPAEAALADRVSAASLSGKTVLAQPTLKAFFELARHASVYVGGDTGPTHLAVAAKAPIVGIFGPTEWWRNGSPDSADICVGRTDIACRIDCHRRSCSNWICMDIDVETVFGALAARIVDQNEKVANG
jgi:lipopolysaccharide heptosyltransferase I